MNTKQALLQFVQQIMHEGIDALIDRIANRVIEKLDEARMSMPQTAAEYDDELPQLNNVTEPQPTESQPVKAYHEQPDTPSLLLNEPCKLLTRCTTRVITCLIAWPKYADTMRTLPGLCQ